MSQLAGEVGKAVCGVRVAVLFCRAACPGASDEEEEDEEGECAVVDRFFYAL